MFVAGNHSNLVLIFWSNAESCLSSTHCTSLCLLTCHGIMCKYEVRLKKPYHDKHSSLFFKSISQEEKSFLTKTPRATKKARKKVKGKEERKKKF